MSELIAVIPKNASEEIRIELRQFNGNDHIHIRVWTEPRAGGGDRIRTKAGVARRVELLPELIEALGRAAAMARAAGLLREPLAPDDLTRNDARGPQARRGPTLPSVRP
jgi:hypothetical protein